jgi:hypothetical protein
MSLTDHITTNLPAELEQILRRADYLVYIKTIRSTSAEYYFRVQDPQNRVLGCSRAFPDRQARNTAFEAFIDFVEIEIHNRRQRQLDFGF